MTISKPFKEKIRMYHVHYTHIQVTDVTGCSAGKRSAQRFHVCTDSDWHIQITSYKDYICQSCLQTRYLFPGLEQCVQTCNGFSSFHLFHIFPVLTNATRYLLGQKKVIVPLHSQNLSPLFLPGPWLFWLTVSFEVAATVSLQKR